MNAARVTGALFFVIFCSAAYAYRQPVHMELTNYAAQNSILTDPALWQRWGIDPSAKFKYQQTLVDFNAESANKNFLELLMYGVDSEDTNEGKFELKNSGYPYLYFSRAFNHFYNPQGTNSTKLDILKICPNFDSPHWELEDAINDGSGAIPWQNFSYADAQTAFFYAFAAPTEAQRNLSMGKMFQSLGHVIHHVQDMAQPEHTRLDKHIDAENVLTAEHAFLQDDSSIYEEYTQQLLDCGAFTQIPIDAANSTIDCSNITSYGGAISGAPYKAKKIYIGGYPAPKMSSPVDFWHTADNKGLADFSSKNFVTTDTPFSAKVAIGDCGLSCNDIINHLGPYSSELPLPNGTPTTEIFQSNTATLGELLPNLTSGKLTPYKNYKMNFIGIHATDGNTNTKADIPRMVSYSIFNERLNKSVTSALGSGIAGSTLFNTAFATNYFNLDQWAATLLPRATAYSSGLINYFFRMDFKIQPIIYWGSLPEWDYTNKSDYDFKGRVYFFFDDTNGVRQFVSATDPIFLAKGKTIKLPRLEVNIASKPTHHFYAIAVEERANLSSYAAVAVTRFENDRFNGPDSDDAKNGIACGTQVLNTLPQGLDNYILRFNTGTIGHHLQLNYYIYSGDKIKNTLGAVTIQQNGNVIYKLDNAPTQKQISVDLGIHPSGSNSILDLVVPLDLRYTGDPSMEIQSVDAWMWCY